MAEIDTTSNYNPGALPDGSIFEGKGLTVDQQKELETQQQLLSNKSLQTKNGQVSLTEDTITLSEANLSQNIKFVRENGSLYLEILINNPDAPQLPPPKLPPGKTNTIPEKNTWYNGSSIVALADAFAAMYLALQKQKRLDKMIELNLANVSYQMSLDSAKLRIDLGKIEEMEHIMGAVTTALVGVASAMTSLLMPNAMDKGRYGAGGIALFEGMKASFQALGEAVKAIFAMPKATTEAAKIVKDAANQLLLANKESAAQAAKEGQDELNRVLQQLSDIIQRYKDAMKMVQA